MNKVVIVAATRTAIGKFGGSLKHFTPGQLGAIVLKDALQRVSVAPEAVDEVIMGNVLAGGHGMNIARQSAMWAGLPQEVPAYCINKVCGSGLKAIVAGAQSIMLGEAEVILAGGAESMSLSMHALKKARWGMRMGHDEIIDMMVSDGLWDVFNDTHMGITAENIAEQYGITRAEQDEFATRSQNYAEAALIAGRFKDEIAAAVVAQPKGDSVVFDVDEFPRFGATIDTLAKLKPAFKNEGTVTAGNASGINDGAAVVLLMSEAKAKQLGLKPLAHIVSYGCCAISPAIMGMGPVGAINQALRRADLTIDDLDLIEINEAFAVQAIAVSKELGLDMNKINVNGGAIALGHPIGASGARILVTLAHELNKRQGAFGLASLCIGGGQGIALVIGREI